MEQQPTTNKWDCWIADLGGGTTDEHFSVFESKYTPLCAREPLLSDGTTGGWEMGGTSGMLLVFVVMCLLNIVQQAYMRKLSILKNMTVIVNLVIMPATWKLNQQHKNQKTRNGNL